MANAIRDKNFVTTWMGVSCVDGVTPIPIQIDSATGKVKVDSTTVISVVPTPLNIRDANYRSVIFGVSTADATVALPLYVTPDGAVLIDS
jgi:hypothetical protein